MTGSQDVERAGFDAACDGCLGGYPYMNPNLTSCPCVYRGCTGRVRFLAREVPAHEWDGMSPPQRREMFVLTSENAQTADI